MKRSRGSLTGGTGDVNPQFMTGVATQSAADTTTTTGYQIPVQRTSNRSGQAIVMEVLKVFTISTTLPAQASVTETIDSITTAITTKSFGVTGILFNEPTIISYQQDVQRGAFTAGGTYAVAYPDRPRMFDLTDGAGHGFLVATDQVYVQVASSGTGVVNSTYFKIYYRWKNVGLEEYIGIVQGQQ